MALGIITIVHAVLAVLLIIELGLTAYVVSVTDDAWWSNTPSSFSFMLFNVIWSLLVLIYLAVTPAVLARLYHSLVAVGLLVVTTIFWFAGSIAMAAYIGVPKCHGNNFCQSAQAAVAFGFFIWVAFTGLTIVEGLAFMRSRGHGANADTVHNKPYAGA